jgi:hypothetical protein
VRLYSRGGSDWIKRLAGLKPICDLNRIYFTPVRGARGHSIFDVPPLVPHCALERDRRTELPHRGALWGPLSRDACIALVVVAL